MKYLFLLLIIEYICCDTLLSEGNVTLCEKISCNETEICHPKTFECIKYPQLDDNCDPEFDLCGKFANGFCNANISRCVLNLPVGSFCENNDQVCNKQRGLVCIKNKCIMIEENQHACKTDKDCDSLTICDPELSVCSSALALGDFCDPKKDLCNKTENLFCDKQYAFCVRYLNEEEICSPEYSLCSSGLHCDPNISKCIKLVSYLGLCNNQTDLCDSIQGLKCNLSSNRCEGNVNLDLIKCDENNLCDDNFFCHTNKSICLHYYEVNHLCDSENDFCNPNKGLFCDYQEKKCKYGLLFGAQCSPERDTCVKGQNLRCHQDYKICL